MKIIQVSRSEEEKARLEQERPQVKNHEEPYINMFGARTCWSNFGVSLPKMAGGV